VPKLIEKLPGRVPPASCFRARGRSAARSIRPPQNGGAEFVNASARRQKSQRSRKRRSERSRPRAAFTHRLRETDHPASDPVHAPSKVITELSAREGLVHEPTSMFVCARFARPAWSVFGRAVFSRRQHIALATGPTRVANAIRVRSFTGPWITLFPSSTRARSRSRRIVVPNKGGPPPLSSTCPLAMSGGDSARQSFTVPRDAVIRDGSNADSARVAGALGEGRSSRAPCTRTRGKR